jgi:hypothetical protein
MRSNGVPSFPDPSTAQGGNGFGVDGYSFNLPANLSTSSPAYESAQKTCGPLIGLGSSGDHSVPAKARLAAIAHAQCMRQHGVPGYPDPSFNGGSVSQSSGGGPGVNARAPAFQQAQKACQPT